MMQLYNSNNEINTNTKILNPSWKDNFNLSGNEKNHITNHHDHNKHKIMHMNSNNKNNDNNINDHNNINNNNSNNICIYSHLPK